MGLKFRAVLGALLLLLPAARARAEEGPLPPRASIKTDHPRLLVRPRQTRLAVPLATLRDLPRGADFKAMLDRLKGQDDASAQAMVWLLTNDPAVAERAVKRLRAYRMPAKAETFEAYYRLREFALAYDWLYDAPAFGKAVRAEVRANVAPLAGVAVKLGDDHVFHNYTWMSDSGLALWGLATAGEDEESGKFYDVARGRFNDRLFPGLRYLEGLPGESMGYWAQYHFSGSVTVTLAAQSATETDLVAAVHQRLRGLAGSRPVDPRAVHAAGPAVHPVGRFAGGQPRRGDAGDGLHDRRGHVVAGLAARAVVQQVDRRQAGAQAVLRRHGHLLHALRPAGGGGGGRRRQAHRAG